MRRIDQNAMQNGSGIVHVSNDTSHFIEAHEHMEVRSASHPGHRYFASALREAHIKKTASLVSSKVVLTTPVPTALHMETGRSAPGKHQILESLPLPAGTGGKRIAKGSIVVASSGKVFADTTIPASFFADARLMNFKQAPSTTAAVAATTAAPAAGATTPSAAGTADAAAGDAISGGGAGEEGDASDGGGFFSLLFAIVIVFGVVLGLALFALKYFPGRRPAGRLGAINDGAESEHWKSAKNRQNYRKSQLTSAQDESESDQEHQLTGSQSSKGQGRGMLQAEAGAGGASAGTGSWVNKNSYRSRRDAKKQAHQEDEAGGPEVNI